MVKRVLSSHENEMLRKLNVSRKVEEKIREVWQSEEEQKKRTVLQQTTSFIIGYFLTPIIIVLLWISMLSSPETVYGRMDNVLIIIVWLFHIVALGLIGILPCITILTDHKKMPVFTSAAIFSWRRLSKLKRVFGRIITIILIIVLAMSEHTVTAVFFLILWLSGVIVVGLVRDKVQKAMDAINQE